MHSARCSHIDLKVPHSGGNLPSRNLSQIVNVPPSRYQMSDVIVRVKLANTLTATIEDCRNLVTNTKECITPTLLKPYLTSSIKGDLISSIESRIDTTIYTWELLIGYSKLLNIHIHFSFNADWSASIPECISFIIHLAYTVHTPDFGAISL